MIILDRFMANVLPTLSGSWQWEVGRIGNLLVQEEGERSHLAHPGVPMPSGGMMPRHRTEVAVSQNQLYHADTVDFGGGSCQTS
jgi:hypothetical protein